MTRTVWAAAGISLVALGSAAQPASIPQFTTDAARGWAMDQSHGDDYLPPDHGPGPVTYDPKHPYVPNGGGVRGIDERPGASARIADITNPILQPWAAAAMKKANESVLNGGYPFTAKSACTLPGVPAVLLLNFQPVYFLQSPKVVWMIWENDNEVRRIYLNRKHSAHVTPSWFGESVGHYEGDTLVVDTIGLSPKTFVDYYRTPHTDQLHVVERYRIIDGGKTLEVNFTVEDPGAFTEAWGGKQHYYLMPHHTMEEMYCAENNVSFFSSETPPPPPPHADRPDF